MSKRFLITLAQGERAAVASLVASGRGPARELARGRILLQTASGPISPTDSESKSGPATKGHAMR